MCLAAVYWSGIRRVVFGASRYDAEKAGFRDKLIYDELRLANKDRSIDMKQILQRESIVSFTMWGELEDKIEY